MQEYHGHRLLVFQQDQEDINEDNEIVHVDIGAFHYGHHVHGYVIIVKPVCFCCKTKEPVPKRCNGCNVAYYCSKQCQEKDWENHKKCCKMVKADRLNKKRTPTVDRVEANVSSRSFNGEAKQEEIEN